MNEANCLIMQQGKESAAKQMVPGAGRGMPMWMQELHREVRLISLFHGKRIPPPTHCSTAVGALHLIVW